MSTIVHLAPADPEVLLCESCSQPMERPYRTPMQFCRACSPHAFEIVPRSEREILLSIEQLLKELLAARKTGE